MRLSSAVFEFARNVIVILRQHSSEFLPRYEWMPPVKKAELMWCLGGAPVSKPAYRVPLLQGVRQAIRALQAGLEPGASPRTRECTARGVPVAVDKAGLGWTREAGIDHKPCLTDIGNHEDVNDARIPPSVWRTPP